MNTTNLDFCDFLQGIANAPSMKKIELTPCLRSVIRLSAWDIETPTSPLEKKCSDIAKKITINILLVSKKCTETTNPGQEDKATIKSLLEPLINIEGLFTQALGSPEQNTSPVDDESPQGTRNPRELQFRIENEYINICDYCQTISKPRFGLVSELVHAMREFNHVTETDALEKTQRKQKLLNILQSIEEALNSIDDPTEPTESTSGLRVTNQRNLGLETNDAMGHVENIFERNDIIDNTGKPIRTGPKADQVNEVRNNSGRITNVYKENVGNGSHHYNSHNTHSGVIQTPEPFTATSFRIIPDHPPAYPALADKPAQDGGISLSQLDQYLQPLFRQMSR